MYGVHRGLLPAWLIARFKIQSGYMKQDTVSHRTRVPFMTVVDLGRPSDIHGLVTVQLRDITQELIIVDIGTILGLAHLIPEIDRHWLVNSWMDLCIFNEIYWDHGGGW